MTIYAVMKTGGKEYRVAPGDVVRVEKLAAAPGATVEIREVCLIVIGQDVSVGSPTVADARVVRLIKKWLHAGVLKRYESLPINESRVFYVMVRNATVPGRSPSSVRDWPAISACCVSQVESS